MPVSNIDNGTAIVRADLSLLAVGYGRDLKQFIGLKVAPALEVEKKRGTFFRRSAASIIPTDTDPTRETGTNYQRGQTKLELDAYATKARGLEEAVDDEVVEDLADNFDLESEITTQKTFELFTAHELEVAGQVFNETNLPPSGSTGATLATWFSDPTTLLVNLVAQAKKAITDRAGAGISATQKFQLVVPNDLLYTQMCMNDQVRGKVGVQYGPQLNTTGRIPEAELARILNIDEVVVGAARVATAGGSRAVWNPNYVALVIVDEAPTPAGVAGYARTLVWTSDAGLIRVKQYREEEKDSTVLQVKQNVSVKVFFTQMGYLFKAQSDQGVS